MGDTARANWSSLVALAVGSITGLILNAWRGTDGDLGAETALATLYLTSWPTFVVIYVAWTHYSYGREGPRTLGDRARQENSRQQRWWYSLVGYGGASSWTLSGAIAAVALTVGIAQASDLRGDPLYIGLGILSVASSWALMVYAFALQYLRLEAAADHPGQHIAPLVEDDPRFGDYLTLAVLLSTMAATASAEISSRRAWTVVRTNVLLAFAFNSVIVAMMVSLLFGNLV